MNEEDLPWLFPAELAPAEHGFSDKAYSCGTQLQTLSCSFLPGNHAWALHIEWLCLLAVWIALEPLGRALQKHNTFYLKPIQNHSGESESFSWRITKDLVKLVAEEKGSKAKKNPYTNRKLPLKKQTLNTVYTDPWHQQQVSPASNLYLRGQISVRATSTHPPSRLLHNSALVFMKYAFCKGRAINRCSFICLLESWVKQQASASCAERGLRQLQSPASISS